MTGSRPKALVTAAVNGPGLDLLHQLADLVLDSWLDQPTLRIYNSAQFAERAAAEGASIVIVEGDVCGADLYEQPSSPCAAAAATPPTWTWPRPPRPGSRCCARPARNADAVAELTVALLFAATRGSWPPTGTSGRAKSTSDGNPLPAIPRLGACRPHGRPGGAGGGGPRVALAAARPRHGGPLLRPLRRRTPPLASTTSSSPFGRFSIHAPVTAETTGMIGADEFAKMRDGVVYLNTARAKLHDTDALVAALASGRSPRRASTTSRVRFLATDHPLTRFPNVVLTPHIGGANYDTEVEPPGPSPRTSAGFMAGARPLHIMNPEVLSS